MSHVLLDLFVRHGDVAAGVAYLVVGALLGALGRAYVWVNRS